MPTPNTNRIQVDLDIMQAEAIQKLESFGSTFNNTVDRLSKLLETTSDRLSSGSGVAGSTLGDNASTVAGTASAMQNVPHARQGGTTLDAGDSGGASTPGTSSFESDYIRAQRRIGESAVPVGLRQTLGYAAEGQLNFPNLGSPTYLRSLISPARTQAEVDAMPEGSEKNQAQQDIDTWANSTPTQYRAGKANDFMFNTQALKANAMLAMGKYTGFFGGVQNITQSGYQTDPNAGTHGILGSSLFSGAFWHGLNESVWQPGITSDFGLNPAYSMAQAQQARQTINQYGWSSGNMGNWLSQVLKENTIHYQMDPQSQMAFLDPMLRWGGWQSFGQLNTVLGGISSAAQSAGMNLSQFTEELVQTSQQVAEQTGNTPGVIAGQISAISATTGLAPSVAGQMESIQNIQMAAAYTGKNPWDIYAGGQNQAVLAVGLTRFRQAAQMPIAQLMKMRNSPNKNDRELYKQKMWQMTLLYGQDPQIFGGMSPLQLTHMITQNGSAKTLLERTHVIDAIHNMSAPDTAKGYQQTDTSLEHMMTKYSHGAKGVHMEDEYKEWLTKEEKLYGKTPTQQQRKDQALQILGSKTAQQRLHASRKMMIDLSPDAKKYFQLQNDPGHTNSGGVLGFARSAISNVVDPGGDLESLLGGG